MRGTTVVRMMTVGAAALAGSAALAQSDISFSPKFFEGQQFTYQMQMRIGVSQTTGDADASDAQIVSSATCNFTVTEANADGSARAMVNVMQVDFEGMNEGQSIGYSWPMAFEPAANAPMIDRLGQTLCSSSAEVFIASDGTVTVENGFEQFIQQAKEIAGSDARLMGMFNPETFGTIMTPMFSCDGAIAKARDQGDTWSSTDLIPIPPIGLMDLDSTFTFIDFNDNQASYSGMTTFSFHGSGNASGAMADFEIVEQSGVTKGTFNVEQGLAGSRTSNIMIRSKWTLGDVAMEQTQDSSFEIALVDVDN